MLAFDLGCISYNEAFELQCKAQILVQSGHEDIVFFLEHTPTVSIGKHFGKENVPPRLSEEWQGELAIVHSTRGGNITCHFPGQLVVYPIINLRDRKGGLRQYVHDLEETAIAVLGHFGICAQRRAGFPGVWVGMKKIASLGLAVNRHITMHGIALNVDRNLSLFNVVSPCGLNVEATSIALQLQENIPDLGAVKAVFWNKFKKFFDNAEGSTERFFLSKQDFLHMLDKKDN